MNLPVMKAKINVGITGLALTLFVFSGLLAYNAYWTSKRVTLSTTRFAELIKNNEFALASEIFDDVGMNTSKLWREQALTSMRSVLENKVVKLTEQVLAGETGFILAERAKGLKLFQPQLGDKITSELERLVNLYLAKEITYQTLVRYYQDVEALGLTTAASEKYAAFIQAEELHAQYYYQEASQVLEKNLQIFPGDDLLTNKLAQYQEKEQELVVYKGPIQHIFFHPLIAYPELAFDNDSLAKGYNDYFVTVKEFNKILDSLYIKNFVLVDFNSIFAEKLVDGKKVLENKELLLPQGKKPLIISIDDLNYYDYMLENGNVHKLILDDKGNVASYSILHQGEEVISRENEIVPILDNFVIEHPDFSYRGTKGTIALTGYQGILGYRTNELNSPNYGAEKDEALQVVKRLKATGWSFASHSYGHPDVRKASYARLVKDSLRWKEEVEPLVGSTNIYIFPYGSKVLPGDRKFEFLQEIGFNIFASVGPNEYTKFNPDYVLTDRRHIDGIAFKYQKSRLLDLFDTDQVIDELRPVGI